MKIQRGVHANRLRLNITLSSEDIETYSVMSDNREFLEGLMTRIQDMITQELRGANIVNKFAPPTPLKRHVPPKEEQ
jgi:hypothetical protein